MVAKVAEHPVGDHIGEQADGHAQKGRCQPSHGEGFANQVIGEQGNQHARGEGQQTGDRFAAWLETRTQTC